MPSFLLLKIYWKVGVVWIQLRECMRVSDLLKMGWGKDGATIPFPGFEYTFKFHKHVCSGWNACWIWSIHFFLPSCVCVCNFVESMCNTGYGNAYMVLTRRNNQTVRCYRITELEGYRLQYTKFCCRISHTLWYSILWIFHHFNISIDGLVVLVTYFITFRKFIQVFSGENPTNHCIVPSIHNSSCEKTLTEFMKSETKHIHTCLW